jgi:hypothetical protein
MRCGEFNRCLNFRCFASPRHNDGSNALVPHWKRMESWGRATRHGRCRRQVRFQVKTQASKQLWVQEKTRRDYDFDHATHEVMPKYFFPRFQPGRMRSPRVPPSLFSSRRASERPQSDLNTYAYFVVPVSSSFEEADRTKGVE